MTCDFCKYTIPTLGTAIKDRKKYRGNKTVTWVISKSFYGHNVCCEYLKLRTFFRYERNSQIVLYKAVEIQKTL